MGKTTTIDGIERYAIGRDSSFSYAASDGTGKQFEVLYSVNSQPRRLALCNHEKDARIIVQAMREYVERGGDWV